jgi:hypothetical protein
MVRCGYGSVTAFDSMFAFQTKPFCSQLLKKFFLSHNCDIQRLPYSLVCFSFHLMLPINVYVIEIKRKQLNFFRDNEINDEEYISAPTD